MFGISLFMSFSSWILMFGVLGMNEKYQETTLELAEKFFTLSSMVDAMMRLYYNSLDVFGVGVSLVVTYISNIIKDYIGDIIKIGRGNKSLLLKDTSTNSSSFEKTLSFQDEVGDIGTIVREILNVNSKYYIFTRADTHLPFISLLPFGINGRLIYTDDPILYLKLKKEHSDHEPLSRLVEKLTPSTLQSFRSYIKSRFKQLTKYFPSVTLEGTNALYGKIKFNLLYSDPVYDKLLKVRTDYVTIPSQYRDTFHDR